MILHPVVFIALFVWTVLGLICQLVGPNMPDNPWTLARSKAVSRAQLLFLYIVFGPGVWLCLLFKVIWTVLGHIGRFR